LQRPGCEEDAEYLNVTDLLDASLSQNRQVVFGGTDYRVVTMSTTSRLTLEEFYHKVESYNRFSILANFEVSVADRSTETNDQAEIQKIKCIRVTAEEIN
jgi:hypothetical protein